MLYFDTNPDLRDVVFLSPQKVANLMADFISFDKSKPGTRMLQNGVLKHSSLDQVWRDERGFNPRRRKTMLALLHFLELALPLPDGNSSLLPAMLDSEQPQLATDWLKAWENKRKAKIQVSVKPLLPPDLFPRLIVRLQNLATTHGFWLGGALLEKQQESNRSRAVLSLDQRARHLTIECGGEYPEGLRGQLYNVLEKLIEDSYHGVHIDVQVSCPQCEQWACRSSTLSKALAANVAKVQCQECLRLIPVADLSAGIVAMEQAERALELRMEKAGDDPRALESLRREYIRFMHSMIKGTRAWAYGKPRVPLLWVPVKRSNANGVKGWTLQPLCEHLDCWHVVPTMSVTTENVSNKYFARLALAVNKLAGGKEVFHPEASAEALTASSQDLQVRDPLQQDARDALADTLIRWYESASASGRKRGRGDGGRADAIREKPLRAVSALESPTLWLCQNHAPETEDNKLGMLELLSSEYFRWEWKDIDGDHFFCVWPLLQLPHLLISFDPARRAGSACMNQYLSCLPFIQVRTPSTRKK